jgi:phosphate transport system ATP-binding protein
MVTEAVLECKNLSVWYDQQQALRDVSFKIPQGQIVAIIGPSGCGKSTLLRCFNRLNDLIPTARIEGAVYFNGENIYKKDAIEIRRRIGMVFQKPNPFPKSVYDNVAFGPRLGGGGGNLDLDLDEIVEQSLRKAALWDEVKDNLRKNAFELSGGQQQRLCIARALAVEPEVLLMDEPCSALDPTATAKIEDLIFELKGDYTVVIVTHNMQQAARVSDLTAVFLTGGELVEYDETKKIFENPQNKLVEDYITGKFG